MSLKINTNTTALTALHNLDMTNTSMQGSITRLSTGLRIVSAADDPAGLVISEGMRAQLRGIDEANSNTQDAINLAKTADGAMNEVQTLLSDMRALAVQSANSAVVDSAQLAANQGQIANSIASINRVATSTQWGTKNLLDGTAGVRSSISDINDVSSAYLGSSFNGYTVASGPLTIQVTTPAVQSSLTTNKTFAGTSSLVTAGSFVINGTTFTANGTTDTISDMMAKINAQSATTGVTASLAGSAGNYSLKLTSNDYGSDYSVDYFDTSNLFSTSSHPSPTVPGVDAVATVTATVLNKAGSPIVTTSTFTGGKGDMTSGLSMTDADGNRVVLTATGNGSAAMTSGVAVGAVTTGNVQFQIGANAGQTVSFSMPDLHASKMGNSAFAGLSLADIDVTTPAGATQAIQILDDAISQLSSTRGDLGSFQKNILESTSRTLTTASENVTASVSTIRDADVAAEMTEFTKDQILQQSGAAMLAQANQIPSQVLKLLQGG